MLLLIALTWLRIDLTPPNFSSSRIGEKGSIGDWSPKAWVSHAAKPTKDNAQCPALRALRKAFSTELGVSPRTDLVLHLFVFLSNSHMAELVAKGLPYHDPILTPSGNVSLPIFCSL